MNKPNRSFLSYLSITFLLVLFITFSNYFRIPISGISDLIKYGIHFIILSVSVFGIFILFAANKWIFLITAPLILLISISSACSLYFFNFTITSEIIEVIIKTDWQVSKEFISFQLIALVIITLLVIVGLVIFRFHLPNLRMNKKIWILTLSFILILPAIILNKKRNNTIIKRVPYSFVDAYQEYRKALIYSQQKRQIIAPDAKYCASDDSLIVMLVLGESLRNDHLTFNGYTRNTTPKLSSRTIYSFKHNRSLFTHTAASVPQILTRSDLQNKQASYNEESVLDIFKRAGFETTWLANQVPDYTYAGLAKKCDHYHNLSERSNSYSDKLLTDQNILNTLDSYLEFESNSKKLIVLHSMGSHWYYNYRCPEEMRKFKPITNSRSFSNNSADQMINSYDNSVVFTDYFIDNIITKLEGKNAILIFVSDHGESLGENGKWLHAFENESLYNAACFIWLSNEYMAEDDNIRNLIANGLKTSNTSSIFHTLLQAGHIQSKVFRREQSLFSPNYSAK